MYCLVLWIDCTRLEKYSPHRKLYINTCIKDVDQHLHETCTVRLAVHGCVHRGCALLRAFTVGYVELLAMLL